jgi:hypothetical protein
MRKADLRKIHDRFEKDLEHTRERLTRLQALIKQEARGRLMVEPKPDSDLTWLFEAACMTTYARWVTFTQELFVGLLNRDASALQKSLSPKLPKHLAVETVEALLTWQKNFPTDPDDLKGLANDILAVNPFAQLTTRQWKAIKELHAIRNAVAHPRSQRAKKRYRDALNTPKGPGPFLKAKARPDGQPRLIDYIDRLIEASKTMRKVYTSMRSP